MQYNTKKRRFKRFMVKFLLIMFLFMSGVAAIGWFGQKAEREIERLTPVVEAREIGEIREIGKEPTIQEYVFEEVKKALGVKEAIKAVSIVQCESGWNPEATNVNKDKTIDRGLWQINNHFQKQVSGACAYDYKCATKEAIKIYQKRGNWGAWVCGK